MNIRPAISTARLSGLSALGLLAAVALLAGVSAVRAQDPAAAPPAAAPADPAAAPPAGAPATVKASAAEPKAQQSTFWWLIHVSGLIGAVILALSVYFVSTVSRLFIELRPVVAAPPELVEELNDLLSRRDFKEIYSVVKEDTTFFGRLLATGISELPNGLSEARDAMERVGEAVTVEMEKRISMLAVLGTLGPMIGLLGTLKGMIAAFSVIAMSDTQLKASDVANAISEALVLTFEGVALSVPAIYFYAVFRNRVASISVSTVLAADEFLRHLAHAARPKNTAAQAAAASSTAPKPAKS